MRPAIRRLARLYSSAPEGVSGAAVSWRTLPWLVPIWLVGLASSLLIPNHTVSSVVIGIFCVLLAAMWWRAIGRHWHPLARLRRRAH
jgi:hypothetical protein